tara:strand:+ start:169 stop:360 length:192 start_codon:yes stop_codon:yes gene_type:complete
MSEKNQQQIFFTMSEKKPARDILVPHDGHTGDVPVGLRANMKSIGSFKMFKRPNAANTSKVRA